MCGITGIYKYNKNENREDFHSTINAMTITVAHRGQDSSGIWIDDYSGVGLGHRRLAISDLSKTGHQPIVSTCGRFVITYNGEVDSHNEVRKALEKRGLCLRGDVRY